MAAGPDVFVLVLIFQSPRVQAGRLGRDGEFWRDAPVFHDPAALAERGATWDALEDARRESLEAAAEAATTDAADLALENDATAAAAAAAAAVEAADAATTAEQPRIYADFKRELSRNPAIQERTATRKQTM